MRSCEVSRRPPRAERPPRAFHLRLGTFSREALMCTHLRWAFFPLPSRERVPRPRLSEMKKDHPACVVEAGEGDEGSAMSTDGRSPSPGSLAGDSDRDADAASESDLSREGRGGPRRRDFLVLKSEKMCESASPRGRGKNARRGDVKGSGDCRPIVALAIVPRLFWGAAAEIATRRNDAVLCQLARNLPGGASFLSAWRALATHWRAGARHERSVVRPCCIAARLLF
jgi:hypothetical protein